jgi:hypothetical protein
MMIEVDAHTADQFKSAACTLGPGAMKERLGEWLALRNRSTNVRRTPEGAVLTLAADEPLDALTELMAVESECCSFYRFSLAVSGPVRELEIDAGPSGHLAVEALLSLEVQLEPTSVIGG